MTVPCRRRQDSTHFITATLTRLRSEGCSWQAGLAGNSRWSYARTCEADCGIHLRDLACVFPFDILELVALADAECVLRVASGADGGFLSSIHSSRPKRQLLHPTGASHLRHLVRLSLLYSAGPGSRHVAALPIAPKSVGQCLALDRVVCAGDGTSRHARRGFSQFERLNSDLRRKVLY